MGEKEKLFQNMENNASEADVEKIRGKLSGMNRGKIAEIWDKVQALWKFVQDSEAPCGGKAIAIGALLGQPDRCCSRLYSGIGTCR